MNPKTEYEIIIFDVYTLAILLIILIQIGKKIILVTIAGTYFLIINA
ncbi:hypothetical protein DFR97_003667 [Clostridium beijerinckii]|nr:hypothetical protein [Clostridium beijerinckii]